MAQHVVLSNSADGTTPAKFKQRFYHNAATAATGSTGFIMPYAGVVTGVYASGVYTQSTDRTDTISVLKVPQNTDPASGTNILSTNGVLSSNNVAGTFVRGIGTSGITASTGSTNPVLTSTSGALNVAKGDLIRITNTAAGANGSAATSFNACVEVEFDLGEDSAAY